MSYWRKTREDAPSITPALPSERLEAAREQMRSGRDRSGSTSMQDRARLILTRRLRRLQWSSFVVAYIYLCLCLSVLALVYIAIGPLMKPSIPIPGNCTPAALKVCAPEKGFWLIPPAPPT